MVLYVFESSLTAARKTSWSEGGILDWSVGSVKEERRGIMWRKYGTEGGVNMVIERE